MTYPTISVVTPSLNQGAYLSDCLASVQGATALGGVQHVVIDGGSTDQTCQILKSQTAAVWISEPDTGQSQAINKGLRLATGEILSYLCADDLLEPEVLDRVRTIFQSSHDVDVVYGDGFFLEGDSGWKRRKNAGPFSVSRLSRGNFLLQPAVFWRRSVTETFGGFREDLHFCMDHEFWLRIAPRTKWVYLPEPLAVCRLHCTAKTSAQLPRAWREAARMQQEYGMRIRPQLEALWMSSLGHHYYRAKRFFFQRYGTFLRRVN
jgi:glycosyltransferase involved in cell wall biosynthesis